MIYLLHFSPAYKTRSGRRIRHYMGATRDIDGRMRDHKAGRGARLLAAAVKRGTRITIARRWRGSFKKEQELKALKNHKSLCSVCK